MKLAEALFDGVEHLVHEEIVQGHEIEPALPFGPDSRVRMLTE